ncbi:MAG: CsbD family protein [Acidimicrobiia bacterium]
MDKPMDRSDMSDMSDMNDRLLDEGRWQQVRGKIRETWGDVTDDDLDQNKGNWDQLVGKIKERTGEAGDAVEKKLREWFN